MTLRRLVRLPWDLDESYGLELLNDSEEWIAANQRPVTECDENKTPPAGSEHPSGAAEMAKTIICLIIGLFFSYLSFSWFLRGGTTNGIANGGFGTLGLLLAGRMIGRN